MRFTKELQEENALLQEPPRPRADDFLILKTAHENTDAEVENEAIESTEHLTLAARATNDAVRVWNVKDGKLCWPQGLESLLGYAPSTVSTEIGFWQRHLHPEDRSRTDASLREALADAENWSGEYRFRRADGVYIHLLERAVIVRNSEAQPIRLVGSLMDITARKQLRDQLCRSQKMEAFGRLASGVAHDFNNYLTTILGYSDLLLGELAVRGQVARHIGEIRGAAGRASALTAQLLAFSRQHPLNPRVLEVNTLISNLERSLLRLLGENVSVECNLHRSKSGVHIKVDPGQITQIILNLVVNARDAMPNGGRLTLTTGKVRFKNDIHPEGAAEPLPAGEYVSISVADNGVGMSDEVKAHLFEPFFTTKEETRGSGLGLATSYGIVRQSGGDLRVESELDRGTKVTIYIPKVAAPRPLNYKRPQTTKPPTGSETVLVLEDDVSVRHIAIRVLRSLGYDVIEAANADDAQRWLADARARKIHLLITDIVMPQMSGLQFAEWLRQASPETKVVFISGYLEESLEKSARPDGEMFFLPKPFDPGQLALKVREVLDGRRG